MRKLFTLFIFALGFCSFTFAKTYNTYDNSSDVTVLNSQYFACGGGENPEKLLDGHTSTKWCSWLTNDHEGADLYANRTPDKIVWKTASPIVVTSYTLTTANDTETHPQRQWKSWTIYGGNFANDDAAGDAIGTDTGWTIIDQVENDDLLPMENYQSVTYNCSHPAEYQYYRLVIDAVHQEHSDHSDIQQMAELTMHYLLASKVTAAPTAKSLTYNGSAQQLINAGTANGGTMYYRLYNSNWSTSIPTATESGTYTVYYKVVGDDTHIDTGEASLNATIGVSSQYSEGPWTPTDRKIGYYEARHNDATINLSFSWNDLNNTFWAGIATVYKDATNGIGSQVQATTADNSKQGIYTLYTATQTIPSYSEMVWNWSFRMSGQYTNLAQQIGLYAGTDLNTLKATALDFTYNNETQAGSDICVGLFSHSAGHPGPSFSAEANHDIRLNNRNGSTDLQQSVYMIQTHIICSYGDANAFGNQWMAFKHLNSSYTYNYYKYITFNANGGSGSMAQQEIENSGTLTANSFTRANCVFTGWNTSADGSGTAYSDQAAITATASSKGPVTLYAQWTFEGNGTADDPYRIPSTDVWNLLSEKVNAGNNYSGKYFRQTADISVTTMAGTSDAIPFSGTYDGYGHTLNVTYTSIGIQTGPFRFACGATIKNLHTTGSITTSHKGAGGIIGHAYDENTIINCRSSVEINSSINGDGTHGGLIGSIDGSYANPYRNIIIEGCVFDGKMLGSTTNCWGGFVGWCADNSQVQLYISNSLYAPQEVNTGTAEGNSGDWTFSRASNRDLLSITNCYYTVTRGGSQGKERHSITAETGVTVDPANAETYYNVSGITSYGTGIKYNDVLYGGQGDDISLNLTHADAPVGHSFSNYSADYGTITGSSNPYTLTMANADAVISANYSVNQYTITFNSNGGSAVEPITQGYGTAIVAPADPTRAYYAFAGWSPELPATMPAEDIELTAQWIGAGVTLSDADENLTTILTALNDGVARDITIGRTIYAGPYNTFCLPFNLSAAEIAASPLQNAILKDYNGADVTGTGAERDLNIHLTDLTQITAGKPFLMKTTTNIENPIFNGVTITYTGDANGLGQNIVADYVDFQGLLAPFDLAGTYQSSPDYLGVGMDGRLYWADATLSTAKMRAFRAFFHVKATSIPNSPVRRGMHAQFVEDAPQTPTGVEPVTGNPSPVTEKILRDGQVIILRNGVEYTVTGQKLK